MLRAAEHLPMRLEGDDQAEDIGHDEQHRQAEAQPLRESPRGRRVGFRDRRGNEQGDGGQEQQARLEPGVGGVELLHVMLHAPPEEGRADRTSWNRERGMEAAPNGSAP
jgi:hypothetical protein